MGWEMLPPEQPVWVSRCCPDECVKERDRLTDRIKELEDALAEEIKLSDALLADVRALVEAANAFFNPTTRAEDDLLTAFREQKIKAENVRQAIAEVEPFLKEVRHIEEKD